MTEWPSTLDVRTYENYRNNVSLRPGLRLAAAKPLIYLLPESCRLFTEHHLYNISLCLQHLCFVIYVFLKKNIAYRQSYAVVTHVSVAFCVFKCNF